ncbi:hypothetical protein ACFLQY_05550 [Verrucomicrobiota bacterium]
MSLTPSTMLELGSLAPDFSLRDVVADTAVSLNGFKDCKALLVMFICCHCPFVKLVEKELAQIARDYKEKVLMALLYPGIVLGCGDQRKRR